MNDSADKLPQQLGGVPPVKIDPALLKAQVARFVKEAYGGSPEKAVQVMLTEGPCSPICEGSLWWFS